MLEEMLKNGKHKITAITRAGSTNKIVEGVHIKKVDYNDQSSLVEALEGQEVRLAVEEAPDVGLLLGVRDGEAGAAVGKRHAA